MLGGSLTSRAFAERLASDTDYGGNHNGCRRDEYRKVFKSAAEEVKTMLQIIQLADGNYRVIVDYSVDGLTIHKEWVFAVTESDAEPSGERITLEFK